MDVVRSLALLVFGLTTLACGPTQSSLPTSEDTGSSEASTGLESTEAGETETETETTETETTDESETSRGNDSGIPDQLEPECDGEALAACIQDAIEDRYSCQGPCPPDESCVGHTCHWGCWTEFYSSYSDCFEGDCLDELERDDLTRAGCYEAALACSEAPECEAHFCTYELYDCLWTTQSLLDLELRFDYAGSCTLDLPGPPVFPELSTLLVGEPLIGFYELGSVMGECDDPDVGGWWAGPDYDQVMLCDQQCVDFMTNGVVRLEYGLPAP